MGFFVLAFAFVYDCFVVLLCHKWQNVFADWVFFGPFTPSNSYQVLAHLLLQELSVMFRKNRPLTFNIGTRSIHAERLLRNLLIMEEL